MMSWGIMFSVSNLNVRAKQKYLFGFCLLMISLQAPVARATYELSEFRGVELPDEVKIRELRGEEINQLRIALGRRSPSNRRAELYFRLAEIYLEAYRMTFLLEGRIHEKRIEKGIQDKFIDRSHSRPYLSSGVQACKEVIGFNIPYEKMDEIYYFLGFYYTEMDNFQESERYYRELIQRFPNSEFAGVSSKELGEFSYTKGNFHQAIEYFNVALKKTPKEVWPPIQHKLAWCYYRVKQFDVAISTMKDAISGASQFESKYRPLRDEALRDMATLMTERGQVEEALEYFQGQVKDPKFFPMILEKLGYQYERNVQTDKAIAVYESLLKTHPQSSEAFRVLVKLVELDIKKGSYFAAVARLTGMTIPSDGDKETQVAVSTLKTTIRKTATDHHQAYRVKNSHVDLTIAESFYQVYLDFFLKKDDSHHQIPEILMYLAEIKKDLGKSTEVVLLYRQVVASKDPKYSKQAAGLWMQSLVEAIKKNPSRPGALEPSPLEKEFIEAADLLVKTMGETPEALDLQLRTAQVLAGYRNSHPEATQRIQSIISKSPRSHQAMTAAQLLLQLALDKGAHNEELLSVLKDLGSNSELLAADQQINKGKISTALKEQERKIKISVISLHEKDKQYAAAAQGYVEFASSSTDRVLVETAYTNAIASYLKDEGASHSALAVIEVWTKRYPRSPKMIDSLRTVATHSLIRGEFELAAQLFERIGREYQEPSTLETAARLYGGLGNFQLAQENLALFARIFPQSPDRWRILLRLALSQERNGMEREASQSYRSCAQGPMAFQAECLSRLADLYLRNKDEAQARELYRKVGSLGAKNKGGSVSPFVGYARFQIAYLTEKEASFEPMRLPEAQLQKGLSQRLGFLEPLSKAYQSVVIAGGPWAIAALHRLALFAVQFADEVDAIEPPASAQGASLEKFKRDLASVSTPLREKARQTWKEAYSKGVSLELLSPVLPQVADHLADYKAAGLFRAQGVRGHFQLAGVSNVGSTAGATTGTPEELSARFSKVRGELLSNAKNATAWLSYGNLLWDDKKPGIAKLAYERAVSLDIKNTGALNNLAILALESEGEEDWVSAVEGLQGLRQALRLDDFYVPAKINLATLFNYYRLFSKSRILWEQVNIKHSSDLSRLGLAIALQGSGDLRGADRSLSSIENSASLSSGFGYLYQEAARSSFDGKDGAEKCLDKLGKLNPSFLEGFEKTSVEYLKEKCELWKR